MISKRDNDFQDMSPNPQSISLSDVMDEKRKTQAILLARLRLPRMAAHANDDELLIAGDCLLRNLPIDDDGDDMCAGIYTEEQVKALGGFPSVGLRVNLLAGESGSFGDLAQNTGTRRIGNGIWFYTAKTGLTSIGGGVVVEVLVDMKRDAVIALFDNQTGYQDDMSGEYPVSDISPGVHPSIHTLLEVALAANAVAADYLYDFKHFGFSHVFQASALAQKFHFDFKKFFGKEGSS